MISVGISVLLFGGVFWFDDALNRKKLIAPRRAGKFFSLARLPCFVGIFDGCVEFFHRGIRGK